MAGVFVTNVVKLGSCESIDGTVHRQLIYVTSERGSVRIQGKTGKEQGVGIVPPRLLSIKQLYLGDTGRWVDNQRAGFP